MTSTELVVLETNSPLSPSRISLPRFQLQPSNHSPVSSKRIYCRCGHGFCVKKTARNERNYGRDYYTCPIKRGARCKYFIKWCDDHIDESYLRPPLLQYPECKCGAGVCRRINETNEFVCPIKQDHGSCGYRVLEIELRNNTSIVPIQQSGCQNDYTDNDLGNDLGKEKDGKEKDGKSPIEAANSQHTGFPVFDDVSDGAEGWGAIEELEASLSSHLSTPSSIQHRQSLFERDISAADPSFGIFPSLDSIVVPGQASNPNGDLAVNGVSKHALAFNSESKDDQFPTISPVEASKDIISPNQSQMSQAQILRKVVLITQRGLLSELENLDPQQHESMREAAEATFVVLSRLGIGCKQFYDHIWDFISLVSSMAEIDKTLENSPTLEEHNKFLEGQKVRLAHIQNDCIKTEALFETFNQQRKLLSKEVSDIEAILHKKQAELKYCELETVKIETRLGDLKRSIFEVDVSLKDRLREAEVRREKSLLKQTKQIAAKVALQKAKLELEN